MTECQPLRLNLDPTAKALVYASALVALICAVPAFGQSFDAGSVDPRLQGSASAPVAGESGIEGSVDGEEAPRAVQAGQPLPAPEVRQQRTGISGDDEVAETYGPPVPTDISTQGANAPYLGWYDAPAFIPPALQEAITLVTTRDPAAQAAWWRVRAADAGTRSARWQRFPSARFNSNISTADNFFLPSLTIDLPLWAGGRIGASINQAKTREAAAEAGWDEVVLDLAIQVSDIYYDIVLNTRLQGIYEDSLAAHLRLVGTMERRVDQRVSAEADLQLALSRAAQIEQELLVIQTQRDTGLQTLAELIRDPEFDLGVAPEFDKAALIDEWQNLSEEALGYSPTLRRLSEEAKVADYEIDIARGSLFPQISAQFDANDITGSRFGLGVTFQTGNGLSRFADIDNAQAQLQSANNEALLFERQFRQQLVGELTLLEAALARSEVSLDASVSAQKVSESYLRQFIAGRRSWLDVMNSLREDLAAKTGLAQAEVTAMSTSARLHLRSGRWRPERISSE